MNDENQNPAGETPVVPTSEETVSSVVENEEHVPETQTEQSEQSPKMLSQEQVDAEFGKRLARERRKWERELRAKTSEPLEVSLPANLENLSNAEDYRQALKQHMEQLITEREAERQHDSIVNAHKEREEAAIEKYEDYITVAHGNHINISQAAGQAIRVSEIGPEIAYYLGSNPKEADRIFHLNPLSQVKEIGRIEEKLVQSPPVKKVTSAPPPIKPLSSVKTANAPSYDTTDPRSTKSMSTSEWIEAERQRQRNKMKA